MPIIETDYEGLEQRIFASLGVPVAHLRGPLREGVMFDVSQSFTAHRRLGKMANFAHIYGTSPTRFHRLYERLYNVDPLVGPAIDFHAAVPISAIRPNGNRDVFPPLTRETITERMRREIMEDVDRDILQILGRTVQAHEDQAAFAAMDLASGRFDTLQGRQQNAIDDITAEEDRRYAQAVYGSRLRSPLDARAYQPEFTGTWPTEALPPLAVVNPRAIERLTGFPPMSAIPVESSLPTLRVEDIRPRQYRLHTRWGSMPRSTNPHGEMDFGLMEFAHSPPPKLMSLEQMKKVALCIRPTAWQKLLKDEDPF